MRFLLEALREASVRRWLPAALCLAVACQGRKVDIQVFIPGPDSVDAPVAHLRVVALPYDRDSVLAAMETKSPRPAHLTEALDSLFQRFRGPFIAYAGALYKLGKLQQTVGRLQSRRDSLAQTAPGYDELTRAIATRSDSIAAARQRRTDAQLAMARARAELAPPMDSLRRLMRQWEDSTYRGYDSITQRLGNVIGREAVGDSTGPTGEVTLRLGPGRWWLYARSWDAWDPNSEWYWNVPVTGDRIVLDRKSGRQRPRY